MSRSHNHFGTRTLLVFAVVLVAMGLLVHAGGADTRWLLALHAREPSRFEAVAWSCITVLGMTWSALILLIAMDRHTGRLIALLVPAFVLGSLLTHVPKFLLASPRPAATPIRESLHVIGYAFTGPVSMPSGHALTIAAAAALVAVAWPGAQRVAVSCVLFAVAAVVAFSRLVVGAHWPSDVLVGFGLGLLAVALALRFEQPVAALARRVASRAGQLWVAVLELALAVGFVSERTGYPEARPMVLAIACVALLSAAWRTYAALRRREWTRAGAT